MANICVKLIGFYQTLIACDKRRGLHTNTTGAIYGSYYNYKTQTIRL